MTRTSIVVRPMSVRPVSTGPTQAKCSSQMSWRGWKSRVSKLVSGSRPPIFGPLWRLSFRQDNAKFSATVGPWCCSAMTWSIWKDRTSSDSEPTVFAGVFGAVPNQTFQCLVHRVRRQGKRARPKRSEPWRGSG